MILFFDEKFESKIALLFKLFGLLAGVLKKSLEFLFFIGVLENLLLIFFAKILKIEL